MNSMMKNIISGITLEKSEKRFSNQSTRKILVRKMKKANLERSAIAKATGHRNIQSLDDYDEADEDEQRQLSCAISKREQHTKTKASGLFTWSFCFKGSSPRHDELTSAESDDFLH